MDKNSIIIVILRVLSIVFLLIALIVIGISEYTVITFYGPLQRKYMFSTIVLGFLYNLLQLGLSIFSMVSRKRVLSADIGYLFDFFADKIISYFLVSGCAAGFGFSVEMVRDTPMGMSPNPILEKANSSATLLLFAFLFNAIASVFTSFALSKKTN
ncbi:hypothetical protein RJT34_18624 [Clitoria ternatea]|uniref:CASP-like protein n=1 Tax=Clitoria ternatea TaxID=43366 RepID=A0AAN9PEH2_CLITE